MADFSTDYDLQLENLSHNCIATTQAALATNLDFHGANGSYDSHAWHPFPAKFPPQLPEFFIHQLSKPGDLILDPMLGSGTTLVEALRLGRRAVGCDIDPLARMIATAKLAPIDPIAVWLEGKRVLSEAREDYHQSRSRLERDLAIRFDPATQKFVHYWFPAQQQLELLALVQRIESLPEGGTRDFLCVIFSSTIIAKSGGVSLARDLAHTRPHRDSQKAPLSAFVEFSKRLQRTASGDTRPKPLRAQTPALFEGAGSPALRYSPSVPILATSAAQTGLPPSSVDLIVTSPPYANNAIDYMRAHKFSLVWFGWKLAELTRIRSQYVGHDATAGLNSGVLPAQCEDVLAKLSDLDQRKGLVLRRYFEEMTGVIVEMRRVLKPDRAAIMVIGSSRLRGLDVETHKGLAAIGECAGFVLAGVGTRLLDRDKRMMPARWDQIKHSQIEKRMHEEYVVGLVKP